MRRIDDELRDGAWRGKGAVVFGSGPSLSRRLDLDGDLVRRHGMVSIGANAEYHRRPEVAILSDLQCLNLFRGKRDWCETLALRVIHEQLLDVGHFDKVGDESDYVYAPRRRELIWSDSFADGLYPVTNTGAMALHVASILGADPIFLVGFDMGFGPAGESYHHNYYPPTWKAADWALKRYRRELERVRPEIEKRSRLFVVGPSKLSDEFERLDLEDFLLCSDYLRTVPCSPSAVPRS